MTLREFYKLICKEFNDGEPLEYKYTEPGGYWRMTKGFDNAPYKVLTASQYLAICEVIKRDIKLESDRQQRSRGRPKKKVQNKYVGDLYE